MSIQEEWKDVTGYEGRYIISNLGDVRYLAHYTDNRWGKRPLRKEKSVRSKRNYPNRYITVTLFNGVKWMSYLLHRLLAIEFIPNPQNLPEVNHIDGDKHNYNLSNLEWVTVSENRKHAYRIGLKTQVRGEKWVRSILTDEEVRIIKTVLVEKKRGNAATLAKRFDVCAATISAIQRGVSWTHIKV